MKILSEYSIWYFLFCVAFGFLLSFILYFNKKEKAYHKKSFFLLFSIRGIYLSLIAFLLLSPFIRTENKISEKPLIIIGADNSESIKLASDSAFYINDFPKQLKQFAESLKDKFDVKLFSFGGKIENDFKGNYIDKTTDFSDFFKYVTEIYGNKNIGSIIVASDGLYNKGSNPLYALEKPTYPVYTIAMGDSLPKTDAYIKKITCPKTVYLKNNFPIEVNVQADNLAGNTCVITLSKNNKVLQIKEFKINSNKHFQSETFWFTPDKAEIQHLQISINKFDKEFNLANNNRDIFVNVIENKKKILLLYNSPHPDISALKQSFDMFETYDFEEFPVDNFNKNINQYDLVVLHQLPSSQYPLNNLISTCQKTSIPILYIIGNQTNISAFNQLETGLSISISNQLINESQASLNSNFSQFSLSDDLKKYFKDLPPLNCFFGNYKILNQANILAYQKIGSLITQYPSILFINNKNYSNGIITGEGIWRWRLSNFNSSQNHFLFDELIDKVVQYMLSDKTKTKFKIVTNSSYFENESVEIGGELYNDSYELINTPDVNIKIARNNETGFNFLFNRTDKAYNLNVGSLPVGIYSYKANTKLGDKNYDYTSKFIVNAVNIETEQNTADHNLMFQLATKNSGKMFYPNQLNILLTTLKENNNIKALTYSEKKFTEIIQSLFLFLIVILFVSIEWIIRKRNGTY